MTDRSNSRKSFRTKVRIGTISALWAAVGGIGVGMGMAHEIGVGLAVGGLACAAAAFATLGIIAITSEHQFNER